RPHQKLVQYSTLLRATRTWPARHRVSRGVGPVGPRRRDSCLRLAHGLRLAFRGVSPGYWLRPPLRMVFRDRSVNSAAVGAAHSSFLSTDPPWPPVRRRRSRAFSSTMSSCLLVPVLP